MSGAGGFRGLRVFVTGHTGFKGGWLCEWLLGEGAIVGGLALPPTQPSLFEDLELAGRMVSTFGDIRDPAVVAQAMAAFAPDIVFHLAAQALVRAAYADPAATFAANVMGTVHVFEAARACLSVRAIVCVTSDKCYDNREWVWGYRETDALGGRDPYSASKGAAEIVAGSYRQAIFPIEGRIRLATVRAGNVIGGGDWSEDRLVPDLVRALEAGRPIVLRNPGAVRPWQHVLDCIGGYLALGKALLESPEFEGAWNFGPDRGQEITVLEMVRAFTAAWGAPERIELEPSHLPEAQTLRLDIAKAHALLGWRPKLSLPETIALTADWHRRRAASPSAAAAQTRRQIEDYQAKSAVG